MNGFQYAVAAWLPIVIFPQTMAPTFRYGFPGTFGLVITALVAVIAIQLLHIRSTKVSDQDRHSSKFNVHEESGVVEESVHNSKDIAESKVKQASRST